MTAPAVPESDEDYDPRPFIEAQEWTFAKSMPDEPHYYVVMWQATDRREWQHFVRWIRQTGEWRTYRGFRYRYVTVEGWRYWSVGRVLNRAEVTPGPTDTFGPA